MGGEGDERGVGDGGAAVEVHRCEGRAVGGEGDERGVGDVATTLHAGRLLVPRQPPRVGHEDCAAAGKETHDDAVRAGAIATLARKLLKKKPTPGWLWMASISPKKRSRLVAPPSVTSSTEWSADGLRLTQLRSWADHES